MTQAKKRSPYVTARVYGCLPIPYDQIQASSLSRAKFTTDVQAPGPVFVHQAYSKCKYLEFPKMHIVAV